MNEIERQKRLALAEAVERLRRGSMERRDFLNLCARTGFALGSMAWFGGCRPDKPPPAADEVAATAGEQSASTPGTIQQKFLAEVGGRFKGKRLVLVGEDTPPSRATIELLKQEFTPLTGIEVTWEQLPLDQVLARVASATARQTPTNDIFYLDQAWAGHFVEDTVDPRELLENRDLAYPGYDYSDILVPLIEKTASYKGRTLGIPFDIPIFILMYRKDILDQLDLKVPTTMTEFTELVVAIHKSKAPQIYGTVGQWKAGHYALVCETASWLWAHGGSFFGADERSRLGDEAAEAALNYMMRLGKFMEPGVTTWSWNERAEAFARGRAGVMMGAGEWFNMFDDPRHSKIVGLAEAAPCPKEIALRPAEQCGFDETPGIARQGGSCLAISRHSKQIEPAWIFLQWATSADVTVRAGLLGGGASPIRRSNYRDPRVQANARVMPGTTRHLPVTLDAIENRMGTEPHLPAWADLAAEISVEMGRFTTGRQSVKKTLARLTEAANKAARAG